MLDQPEEVKKSLEKKDDILLNRLKQIYVTSEDPMVSIVHTKVTETLRYLIIFERRKKKNKPLMFLFFSYRRERLAIFPS